MPKVQMSLFELDPKTKEVQEILSKIDINTLVPLRRFLS